MAGRGVPLLPRLLCCLALLTLAATKKFDENDKPSWAKKDIRDYSDADLERLLEQWDEDEDPLPEDELPEHLRPQPQVHFDPSNIGDPEQLLKMSKKGRTLMMFVQVKDALSPTEAEEVTKLWQSSLFNSHIQAERYMVDERRAIFMFKDGSQAWDAKDFLLEQKDLREVSVENKVYHGYFTPEGKQEREEAIARKLEAQKTEKKKRKKTEL